MQVGKGFAKVLDERLLAPTLHSNVVDVRLHVAPDLGAEALPHSPLKGTSCILEQKHPIGVINVVFSLSSTAILIY
jgi:hypothetical protein